MGLTNYPRGISSFGIPVLPPIMPVAVGSVFFVSSVAGSDGNSGTSAEQPFATLQKAVDSCTSAKGDVIYVMPGHAETVTATNMALNKSMVAIIGIGIGASRPVFTFGAAAATFTVSAAAVSVINCHFSANFANVVTAFTLTTATDFSVTDSSFVDVATNKNFLAIVTTDATTNHADGLTFSRNHVIGLAATDGPVVSVLAIHQRLHICDNTVDKLCTNDAGHLVTFSTFAVTGVRILRNQLTFNALASQSTGTMLTGSSTACSGIVADNRVYQIDTSTGLLATAGTKLGFSENYVSGAADKSGSIFPAVDDPA